MSTSNNNAEEEYDMKFFCNPVIFKRIDHVLKGVTKAITFIMWILMKHMKRHACVRMKIGNAESLRGRLKKVIAVSGMVIKVNIYVWDKI